MTCFYSCFTGVSPHKHPIDSDIEENADYDVSIVQNTNVYTYQELQLATENFSPVYKIGEGGFGSVYKGVLKDGTVVAIKVLSAKSRQGVREFLTEINTIADIKHENLVKLHGFCAEGKHRILVYGYVVNNSLAQTLLGRGPCSIQFSWPVRHQICVGVAQGLAFLHEEVKPPIIHRDIKASNILLDRELKPIISDFGLSKIFPDDKTHLSTRVAGTQGYLAPEYAVRGQLTRKADIYSFGVLLLEIICGRVNTNKNLHPDEQHLVELVWTLYDRGDVEQIVDKSLKGEYDPEEACKFLKIGLLCTQEIPKQRPTMTEVMKMLKGEMEVTNEKLKFPEMLTELTSLRKQRRYYIHNHVNIHNPNVSTKNSTSTASTSISSSPTSTSFATMTFNSMYDRN